MLPSGHARVEDLWLMSTQLKAADVRKGFSTKQERREMRIADKQRHVGENAVMTCVMIA